MEETTFEDIKKCRIYIQLADNIKEKIEYTINNWEELELHFLGGNVKISRTYFGNLLIRIIKAPNKITGIKQKEDDYLSKRKKKLF